MRSAEKKRRLRHIRIIVVFALFVCAIFGVTSCGVFAGLVGVWWTRGFCDQPGACGQSGKFLRNLEGVIWELSAEYGEGWFATDLDSEMRGFAFGQQDGRLFLYVATSGGFEVFEGRRGYSVLRTVALQDCERPSDVLIVDDAYAIVSCRENGRLVKVDLDSKETIEAFDCCDDAGDGFTPVELELTPDGFILAGRTAIQMFDLDTGASFGVVVEPGVEGAELYTDYAYGPNGNLFVVASPDVGILEFDGVSFEFLRIVVPATEQGMPSPGSLAFSPEGTLYVNSYPDVVLREFDPETGELLRSIYEASNPNISVYDIGFRP